MADEGWKPPVTQVTVSLVDYDEEKTSFKVYLPAILNDGSNYGVVTGDESGGNVANNYITGLRFYISPFILGNFNTISIITDNYHYEPTPPSNPFAQRETAFILRYRDSVTLEYHNIKLGTANLALLGTNEETVPANNVAFLALKAYMELHFLSPIGNPIQVLDCRHVGRNL